MTSAKRITDLMLDRQRSPIGGRIVLWDLAEAGLGVRIGAKRRTFILKLRHGGKQQMHTLGQHPSMTVADARIAARKIKSLSAHGVDPAERTAVAGRQSKLTNVAELVEAYIEGYAKPNQRSWKDTAGLLRSNLVRLAGAKPIAGVTRTDILRILDDARSRGLAQGANRLLAHTKRFLGWCVERGVIDQSPASGIRPPVRERARDRVLSDGEIAQLWRASVAMGHPVGSAVQVLLLTGQRRDEVSHMRWTDLDLDVGIWTIPAERNKSGRLHVVPLSPLVVAILQSLPRSDGFVFWGRTPGTAINGWSRAKVRVDELSGVSDWRLHDLRRTAATGMARLGIDPHVVERVLNHATTNAGPLARVYQRYAYEDEKRAALQAWSVEVGNIYAAVASEAQAS